MVFHTEKPFHFSFQISFKYLPTTYYLEKSSKFLLCLMRFCRLLFLFSLVGDVDKSFHVRRFLPCLSFQSSGFSPKVFTYCVSTLKSFLANCDSAYEHNIKIHHNRDNKIALNFLNSQTYRFSDHAVSDSQL